MERKNAIKFKKNESFYIRDGWFEKGLNTINKSEKVNIFSKNNGINYLGIGSNMVKSLRYWMQACGIIISNQTETKTSSFGNLILKYDSYFDSDFTWFLIHYYFCKNMNDCPIFYSIFNYDFKSMKKQDLALFIKDFYQTKGITTKLEYIEDDLGVLLKSYINDDIIDNPEDNYICPLSNLHLLKKRGDLIIKLKPIYSQLSYLIIYFCLCEQYKFKEFNIEDSLNEELSPFLIFNLDRNMYLQYLEEMENEGLVIINKTAGLNIVYFEKKLKLEQIFKMYFGGKK